MLYCVRCGDPIDKNELVCDKCGLRFTLVNEKGATVYINQTPNPVKGKTKAAKKKKGKFSYGWVIALVSVASVALAAFTAIVLLGFGILAGFAVFYEEPSGSQQVVVTDPFDSSEPPSEAPITYQSTPTDVPNEIVSNVIRDQFVKLKGDGTDTVTVMVYMNGSNLESEYGYATEDLREMLNATLSDNVNVVIQTGGTKKWKTEGISNKKSQRFIVKENQLVLVDNTLDQLDITNEKTIRDFIVYCDKNYHADRNILIFWDHGGGVIYGYGVDENISDETAALTIAEIQRAVRDSGVKFEMIGFDSCLMGGLETACVLCDSADYLVASEDFESGSGWEYQNWLSLLGYNSSTPMTDVGKVIVDDFIRESLSVKSDGVLALIDLRYTRLLYTAWTEFAYANESDLLSYDYTMSMQRTDRAPEHIFKDDPKDIWDWLYPSYTMETYCYAVDIMALASTMTTNESNALRAIMKKAVLYCSSTSGDAYMTGLSVTLPYGDSEFYGELCDIYQKCGFDSKYIKFLGKFSDTTDATSYDWDSSNFSGWDSTDTTDDYDWDNFDWESYFDYYYGTDSGSYYDRDTDNSYYDYDYDYDYDSYDAYDDSYDSSDYYDYSDSWYDYGDVYYGEDFFDDYDADDFDWESFFDYYYGDDYTY